MRQNINNQIDNIQLSVCIITKNESNKLKRCIKSFSKLPLEIVVIDTGSSDNTVDMVKKLQEEEMQCSIVLDYFEWVNDFARAKNYAISKAKNDLVFVVDSDEYLDENSVYELKKNVHLMINNKDTIYRIKIHNEYERDGEACESREWLNRIFSKSMFQYEGRIHEQVVGKTIENPKTKKIEVLLHHDGYAGDNETIKKKSQRNVELLKNMLSEKEDPYILYQLGKSYYMMGEYSSAAEYFDKALYFDLNPNLEYVIDLVETYGYALINSNQNEKALNLQGVYDVFGDCADFKFLMGLIYMRNGYFDKAVNEFLLATEYKDCRVKGTNSYLAYYNAGVVCECTGNIDDAKTLYGKCGGYNKAVKQLNELEKTRK